MSVEDLHRTMTIVDAYIALALGWTGVDLMPLTSRLESIVNPERSWSPAGLAREIQLERSVLVREIREGLLPASQLAVAASIRSSRGTRQASDDPWAELDPDFVEARDARCAEVWTKAQLDAVTCCQRFVRTSRVSFLRITIRNGGRTTGWDGDRPGEPFSHVTSRNRAGASPLSRSVGAPVLALHPLTSC